MLARKHRFHGRGSLRHVYQRGQSVRGNQLSLKYSLNERRKTFRAAVVVSRKVNKSAVVRNRIRRRIYEQVRLLENQIHEPYDLVFTVFHEQVVTWPTDQLSHAVADLLQQAKVLYPH